MSDHKAEAEFYLAGENQPASENDGTNREADRMISTAQVHATLYAAEQQRIANVLLYHSTAAQIDFNQLDDEAKKTVREGLGI